MPTDWPILLAVLLGIVALFALAILFGLRRGRHVQASNLAEIDAADALLDLPQDHNDRRHLLYGAWQISMREVVLQVKDYKNQPVASITQRANGADIEIGDEQYRIESGKSWLDAAELLPVSIDTSKGSPISCSFRRKGWLFNRTAVYTLGGSIEIEMPLRFGLPGKPGATPIRQNKQVIGYFATLGAPDFDKGRALLLPSSVPLSVRLFILSKGAGSALKSGGI